MSGRPEAAYSKRHNPKMIVFLSVTAGLSKNNLEEMFSGQGYTISHQTLSLGMLGLPLHGTRTATFLRKCAIDPADLLKLVRLDFCVPLHNLLGNVSKDLADGWAELEIRARQSNQFDMAQHSAIVIELGMAGLLPSCSTETFTGVLPDEFQPIPLDALGTARVELLLHWMDKMEVAVGSVDVSKKFDPVHLDATLPDSKGKKIIVTRKNAHTTAYAMGLVDTLAVLGYSPDAHNVAVMPYAIAERAVCKALPLNLVWACVLACTKCLTQ